ncbi:hypothetical protein LZ518_04560 [Sphingomonas sp. RB56-2]|uniref:Tetratricopeptide repeat protein n=1 Tax=Sphingomonas brevis TaxID=2908206 RepID=A0ABT0S7M9_9SPHN|nr:hypothetical protein [Sphingomonas brevis]MCL6740401.1 hypothetical protein [Sphingomonas brevis]
MTRRAIPVFLVALFLAVLVVRSALLDAYAATNPAKASSIWPGHPSAILASGLTEVGAAAAAAKPVNPATVTAMLAASAKAPLAPEPFLVRGVQAQVANDQALAARAFLQARKRDPRSVPARYFLADHYLATGQTQRGLAEIAALTRLVPKSLGEVAPQLAAFARMPGGASATKRLLLDQPQLEPWLLNELAARPEDAKLAMALWGGRPGELDRAWQQRLVASLVSANRFDDARMAWDRFNPSAKPVGGLLDPGFGGGAMPPFGWTLASGAAGVAEPEGGGRLHVLYYGRDNIVLAGQLLQLGPGTYRFSMKVGTVSPTPTSISWVVRCMPGSRELASIDLTKAKGGVLALDFAIPSQDCPAQQLELVGTAPELPEQAELTIAELGLSRVGP